MGMSDAEDVSVVGTLPPVRLDRHEIAGSVGDLGTLLPLAILLVTANGLSPSAVFGVAGLAYLSSGLYYRIPMAVQPLKSFSALAIAHGLAPSVIASGAMLMGLCLLLLGVSGAAERLSRWFPKALIRGIQLGVGIILIRVGFRLSVDTVPGFGVSFSAALSAGTLTAITLFARNRFVPAGLLVIGGGFLTGTILTGLPALESGAVFPEVVTFSAEEFWTAATLLVLPQLPLTMTNSLPATQDVARTFYGAYSRRVTARALSIGLGVANVAAGVFGGMPVCHGSSGLTAHYHFGARTGGMGVFLGGLLLILAIVFGPGLVGFCGVIPRPVLGAMTLYVGVNHCRLVRDVDGAWGWTIAIAAGCFGGIMNHNGYGLAAGAVILGVWRITRTVARNGRTASAGIKT